MSSIQKILFMLLATTLLSMVNTERNDFKRDGKTDDDLQVSVHFNNSNNQKYRIYAKNWKSIKSNMFWSN